MSDNFVLNFYNRSDGGPRFLGPFQSRQDAEDHAISLVTAGFEAGYCVLRLTPPGEDKRCPERFSGPPISNWSPAPWELS